MEIVRVLGPLRRRIEAFTEQHHYTGSHGGSGYLFTVMQGQEILGACLIGPASSMAAERAIIQAPYRVWNIKRLVCLDDCAMPESQLMRHAMRAVADLRGESILIAATADPYARDERTGKPLLGWVYLAAGMFYVGLTSQPRFAVIDHQGRSRSTRQGGITLTRRTLPKAGSIWRGELVTRDWQMVRIPAARIWLAMVAPEVVGDCQTTRLWRRRSVMPMWRALNPNRKVAAIQWVSFKAWERLEGRIEPLGQPRRLAGPQRFQPALWPPALLHRRAAPAWVPYEHQETYLDEADVMGEQTLHRLYIPRAAYQEQFL